MAILALKVVNRVDEIARAIETVEGFAETEVLGPVVTLAVTLCVDELLANVIMYGFDDQQEHEIELVMTAAPDQVCLCVSDGGRPFDPLNETPPPDLTSPARMRPVGGLGLHIVKAYMDTAQYRRENDRNILTLVKIRPKSGEAPAVGAPGTSRRNWPQP